MTKYDIIDNRKIEIHWCDKNMDLGSYSIEVTGKMGSTDWRFYDRKPMFLIVETNSEANLPEQSVLKDNYYKVEPQSLYILCPRGPKGDKGDKGDPGERGRTGPIGPQGPIGESGLAAYIDTLTNIEIENLLK